MNETQCNDAEASVRDTLFNIVRVFHIIFGTIIVVMVIRNVWSYKTKSLKFHTNLIVSFNPSIKMFQKNSGKIIDQCKYNRGDMLVLI